VLTDLRVSRGLAVGDLDDDGRLDVGRQRPGRRPAGPAQRARRTRATGCCVKLVGKGKNTDAIGAVVKVKAGKLR
jgi:hypothetical protein